jgi:hypothetical protein
MSCSRMPFGRDSLSGRCGAEEEEVSPRLDPENLNKSTTPAKNIFRCSLLDLLILEVVIERLTLKQEALIL